MEYYKISYYRQGLFLTLSSAFFLFCTTQPILAADPVLTPTPTLSCHPQGSSLPSVAPNSNAQNQVFYPNLSADETLVRANLQATVPLEVYQNTLSPTPVPLKVPVNEGFFSNIFLTICNQLSFFKPLFCPLSLSSDTDISNFSNESTILASSSLPSGLSPTPAQEDCLLNGDSSSSQDPTYQGNQKVNLVNQALGHQGYSANTHPQFDNLKPEIFAQNQIYQNDPNNLLNKVRNSDNLNLNGQVFNQDLRSPDNKTQTCLNEIALYPIQSDCPQ